MLEPGKPLQIIHEPRKGQSLTKVVDLEGKRFTLVEIPMDEIWPAGDPCPNDKETLVWVFREDLPAQEKSA